MIRSISTPSAEFNLSETLLYICKKPTSSAVHSSPEIDYLLLEKEVEQLQEIQSRTCQQIVEFVDENREELVAISDKFNSVENVITQSNMVLSNLTTKINDYKAKYYQEEAQIQKHIAEHEESLLEDQLLKRSQAEAQFLIEFVNDFEHFINKNIENLTHRTKFNIVRLLKKLSYLKGLFDHPLVKKVVPDYMLLGSLLENIHEEMEFYLGEQLSRIVSNRAVRAKKVGQLTQLDEVYIWYKYMGKENVYYEIIEETLVGREFTTLESALISNKQALLSGKEEHILQAFFNKLFTLIQEFPTEEEYTYPYSAERILCILYRYLNKKELSFLFTYMMPIFPMSYTAYMAALETISNQTIKNELRTRHNWNLKIWADVRIKSILDRNNKDREQKNLIKWVDIVLKKNCMFEGVKNYMIKLTLQLTNRYCLKLQENKGIEFTAENANLFVKQMSEVKEVIRKKLGEAYEAEDSIEEKIEQLVNSVGNMVKEATRKWLVDNMDMVISTCRKSLENYKTYVFTVINKQANKDIINRPATMMKPFEGYLKNSPELAEETVKFMEAIIIAEVKKYYDTAYVGEIYKYCNSNLTTDQTKAVMERIALEREELFERKPANKEE